MRWKPLLALAALLLAGCPRIPEEPQDVAKDLAGWLAIVGSWEGEEKQVFAAMAAVQKSQYVQDELTSRTLKDALPVIRAHNRKVSDYKTETWDVGEVQKQYKAGWDNLELAFHSVIAAAEAKDYMKLAKAKSDMEYGRGQILGSFASLDELLEENDLQLKQIRQRDMLREQAAAMAKTPGPDDARDEDAKEPDDDAEPTPAPTAKPKAAAPAKAKPGK